MKEAGRSPRDLRQPIGGKTTVQPRSGWWRASCERCIGVVHRASVSLTKPESIDLGGRLERDVPI